MATKRSGIKPGSDNVFADPGYADAGERRLKVKLAVEVNRVLAERGMTQAAAAELLGLHQPHVSDLMRYRLNRFSAERLMDFLTRLGHDVQISVMPRRAGRARSEVRVLRQDTPRYQAGARRRAKPSLELYSDKRIEEFDAAEREVQRVLRRKEKLKAAPAAARLPIPKAQLAALCRKYGIRKLSLFGSAARSELRAGSDVDLMVEFEPDSKVSLWDMPDIQAEFSALFGGRPVDLVPPDVMKNPFRRKTILRDLRVLYEA